MNLDALPGNQRLKAQLAHTDRLPHAILLGGPKGSGRHILARLLAQAMVCNRPDIAPCGVCPNCKRVAEGIHPDVPPLSNFVSSKDRDKKDIVVDTIRNLRADAFIRPNQAKRKVYLIDPAETMNVNAQNALLKVLEDGPEYASFLLLAENPMALLDTIRSRCVYYALPGLRTAFGPNPSCLSWSGRWRCRAASSHGTRWPSFMNGCWHAVPTLWPAGREERTWRPHSAGKRSPPSPI